MNRKAVAVLVVLLCTLFAGVEGFAGGREEWDREAIRERNQAFMNAWEAGNPTLVAKVYSDDAILFYPNAEPFVGRDEIEVFLNIAIN